MKNRSYHQYCGLSYALDVVGERWSLLVIRELAAGPRRFKDLMDGLPGISTNLLSERLKSLEARGVLRRRVLPPPAGSTVYELTPLGQGLEPALLELGRWGSQFVPPMNEEDAVLHLGSYALTLKTFFRPERARGLHESFELCVGEEVLLVQVDDGELQVRQGAGGGAGAVIHTDVPTFLALLQGQLEPEQAVARGLAQVEGDPAALGRLVSLCGIGGG